MENLQIGQPWKKAGNPTNLSEPVKLIDLKRESISIRSVGNRKSDYSRTPKDSWEHFAAPHRPCRAPTISLGFKGEQPPIKLTCAEPLYA
jgi:hypothetical protein